MPWMEELPLASVRLPVDTSRQCGADNGGGEGERKGEAIGEATGESGRWEGDDL